MWFAQKLQNEIQVMKRKACKPRNTLIAPTLTILGTYHLDHFVENPYRLVTSRSSRSSDNRAIVDVHVIMLKLRQKRSSKMRKPNHLEQTKVFPMQEGDKNNLSIDKQEESVSLELEIEVIGKGNNAKKGVENPRISKEQEVAKEVMELPTESLEVTTSVLEKIDISVEKAEESILAIHVNTNKEQTVEEVVITGAK